MVAGAACISSNGLIPGTGFLRDVGFERGRGGRGGGKGLRCGRVD